MKKKYIFILLLATHLILGQTPTGNSTEVGITEGQLSVSLSGGATYSIPIAVPPGINGVVPQVGLTYNSQAGNGMAGYGWNISGVSAITRIPRTKFHDDVAGGVNLDANDRFALDGQRLILKSVGTTYGAAGAIYETESFSNIKITSQGTSSLNPNPSFKVEYPDGSVAMYGASIDSSSITTWCITYWENPQGVRISYSYNLANNSLSIKDIKYGTTGTITPINEIQFVYANNRKRPEQSYVAGQSILINNILKEIKVIGNTLGFRNYVLVQEETSLGYERLKSITEKSGNGTISYNPTNFTYGVSEQIISTKAVINTGQEMNSLYDQTTMTGDFNGDGDMDIVVYSNNSSLKNKFWLYDYIDFDYDFIGPREVLCGTFEKIFPTTYIDSNQKSGDRDGILIVQNGPSYLEKDFTTYVAQDNHGSIANLYSKRVLFPASLRSEKYLDGDFNGDGLTDIVVVNEDQRDLLGSFPIYFIDLDSRKINNFFKQAGSFIFNGSYTETQKFEASDINGDGKTDILHFTNGNVKAYTLNDANDLVLLFDKTDVDINVVQPVLWGDYNGDGKLDFIIPDKNELSLNQFSKFISTGDGLLKFNETYPFDKGGIIKNSFNQIIGSNELIPIDINADGKTDIVNFENNYKLTIFDNINSASTSTSNPFRLNSNSIRIRGLNAIFYAPNKNIKSFKIASFEGNKLHTFSASNDSSKENLLKTITTGNGVSETITYKPLQNRGIDAAYVPSAQIATFPNFDIKSDNYFKVVSMLEKQSASVYKKQLYSYAGATSNVEGLGFLGFRAIMSTNWFNNDDQILSSISKFDPNLRGANVATYTYLGLVAPEVAVTAAAPNIPRTSAITINNTRTATETVLATNSIRFLPGATITPPAGNTFVARITPDYDANGFAETNTVPPSNLISKSLSFYEASLSTTKVYKLQNTQSNTYNILENTGSETVTVYDTYNNPTESISKIRNGGAGEQTTNSTVAYQSPTTSPYAMGRPISKTQTVFSSGDSMTSKETYGYGSGTESNLLKKIEKWGNNTSAITEDNEYDAFGNITKKTITAGPSPRITYYEYKTAAPYYGRFLTESTDIEGLKTTFDYNSNGTLNFENKQTELNSWSNALKTSYEYDSWFKKTKTTDYLGKSNTYVYTRSENVKTKIATTGDDGSYSEELFDDLARKITSGVRDISGVTISSVSYLYDIYNRNIKVSEPYSGTGPTQWNETKYDEYGRTDQKISFTGKTVSVSYSGLTTTVNDGTKTKTSVKNALGNVVSMTDTPGGTINYTYFANGNLKSTNYDGVVTAIEQDGWGRKTKLTDPSAGTYTYAYNGFGETISETTPNGTTTYTLNAVGKLTAKTISGTNTNSSTIYNYNGTTKLLDSSIFTNTLEAGAVTTNTYSYDSYKRLVNTTEATPYATFTKTINLFDAFGRVETETTSGTANGKTSSKTIKNTYKNSYAWQILDNVSQQVLWQTNTVNARGQLLTADLGNGIAITNGYDTYGFASQIKHDKTGNTPINIMTLNTVFDAQKGNLSSRTNNLFGTNDSFTYDSLDRLKTYPDASGATLTQNYYDDGRIKDNTIGTYNYANNNKKYQNTSVLLTPEALTYYKNRGIATIPSPTATRALNITYNTFKSPVEIKEDGIDKISFTYNDNNDRSTMFYGSLDVDKNLRPNRKFYAADGSMEIKQNILTGVTEFITYIGGDGYSAPIVLKSDGTTQNYLYLHRDYQGTILAITDSNAAVLEKRQFDAWGAILKVQDGLGNDLNVLTILDRGYTAHEHLQSVGLTNMNGRLYDPKLHRFLQPDNFVQDPTNTQNFNRYGYVLNNPLRYTDPRGEKYVAYHSPGGGGGGGGGSWTNRGWTPNNGMGSYGIGGSFGNSGHSDSNGFGNSSGGSDWIDKLFKDAPDNSRTIYHSFNNKNGWINYSCIVYDPFDESWVKDRGDTYYGSVLSGKIRINVGAQGGGGGNNLLDYWNKANDFNDRVFSPVVGIFEAGAIRASSTISTARAFNRVALAETLGNVRFLKVAGRVSMIGNGLGVGYALTNLAINPSNSNKAKLAAQLAIVGIEFGVNALVPGLGFVVGFGLSAFESSDYVQNFYKGLDK